MVNTNSTEWPKSNSIQTLSSTSPLGLMASEAPKIRSSSGAADVIAYAVSITGCGSDPLSEGAAILKHSIHQVSSQGKTDSDPSQRIGRYDYRMYAIVHPNAVSCGMTLKELGYTILKRDTPVAVQDIQGEYLRSHIEKNG